MRRSGLRRLGCLALFSLVVSGCATQAALDRWNHSLEERVWLEFELLQKRKLAVYWKTAPRGGEVNEGLVHLSPPLPDCNRTVVYPLRKWGRVAPLEEFETYSEIHRSRIPDSAERLFWNKLGDSRCAVLLTLGLPEEGTRSVLSASTHQGRFATLELQRTVRPEWALALPVALAADSVGVFIGGTRTPRPWTCDARGQCRIRPSSQGEVEATGLPTFE